ncbi:hypothetical protein BDR26DRAFT_853848 [Obelidium mucronatum]|nr:hypothetical protein BDR26DRAFT_853848 [Obelidium mucronatum]
MRAKANSVSAGSDSAVIGDTDTHVTLAPATSNPLLPQADALRYGIMQVQVQRRQFAGFLGRSENPASWTRFAVVALQNLLLLYQFDKDMALATEDLHLHSPNGPFAPCGLEADAMVEFSARLFGSGKAAVSALQLTSQHTLIEVLDVSRCILRVTGLSERKRLMIGTRGKSGGRKEEVVWWIHFDDADSMYRWYVLVKHLLQ